MGEPEYVVDTSKRGAAKSKRYLPKSKRSATPIAFAEWLVELVRRVEGILTV
jgi:hypothetical protein